MKCSGIRKSWPWQGYPCGAVGKYEYEGKYYCANHFAEQLKNKKNKERVKLQNIRNERKNRNEKGEFHE